MNFKNFKMFAALLWLAALIASLVVPGNVLCAVALCVVVAPMLNRRTSCLRVVTLSVPELLTDVLDAFKLETPELFQPGGFGVDFSSKTAVLNDVITAKIAHVPLTGTYDSVGGTGFQAAAQDVTTLIEDVPVTLNQFRCVVVNVKWLTQLASKLDLYKEAIRNYGYALGKYVVDYALATVTPGNFSNQVVAATANVTLDTFDSDIRNALNGQKISNRGRYGIINTATASKLGSDDRVRSSLFYGALNGDQGYRIWRNLAGFSFIREYPDMFAGNNLSGLFGDSRAIAVASRQVDYSNVADQLGIPKVMDFYPMVDGESGVSLTGVAWQQPGTGDVYVGAALLFGVSAGKQGGANGTITDNAGLRLVTA